MKVVHLLNMDKALPRALRKRLVLDVGDFVSLDAVTVMHAQADTDRLTDRRQAVLEVCQPGQIHRHRIEENRFVSLWLNDAPAALVPRAVEFDGNGRVLRMLVDVVRHRADASQEQAAA